MSAPPGYFAKIRLFASSHLSKIDCKPGSASVFALSISSLIYKPLSLTSTTLSLNFFNTSNFLACNYSKSLFFSMVNISYFLLEVSIDYYKILF